LLKLDKISKTWGAFAHREVSFEVAAGEFFVLLGPSGAGKSLLLEIIAGFARPDSGRIFLNGRDVTDLAPERRGVGLVYQDLMLFPHMTIRGNIAYGPRSRGFDRTKIDERVGALAESLDIADCLDCFPAALSVGQKQRAALARALATEPAVLLLDEPFSSLDAPLRMSLWKQLAALHRKTGLTVLHVTHDRSEAIALGERIGVMRDGRIEEVGERESVFDRPQSSFVAEFTGGKNIYRGTAEREGGLSVFCSGALRLVSTASVSGPCRALVRPENIIIAREAGTTSARNRLRAVVETLERSGGLYEVLARTDGKPVTAVVTPQSVEELELAPGAAVCLYFKAGAVHLFRDAEEGGTG